MIFAHSGAKISYKRVVLSYSLMFIHTLSKIIFVVYHKIYPHLMDIIHSELLFKEVPVVKRFFFQFLSNIYKHNNNSYTIIIMNTCISQERLRRRWVPIVFFRVAQHPPGLTRELDSLIIPKNFYACCHPLLWCIMSLKLVTYVTY